MSEPRPRRERLNGRVPHPEPRPCEARGCAEPGEFKAPRDPHPDGRPNWRWLCLDHVRAFNSAYNFFEGMTPDEISDAQSPIHPAWDRATRAFASNGYADRLRFEDNAELMRLRFGARVFDDARAKDGKPLTTADRRALATLGLDGAATHDGIRRRYKKLVRQLHPDTNGGTRTHEGRLQAVIDAYTQLKHSAAFAATAPPEARA